MGKYDGMSLDELMVEVKNAKGYGTRILRKVGELKTPEAGEAIIAYARSAMKSNEVEATVDILLGMGDVGYPYLVRMLRAGDTYINGVSIVGEAVRTGDKALVPFVRRSLLDMFAELASAYEQLDQWVDSEVDESMRDAVRQRMINGYGDFTTPEQDEVMERNRAFLALASPDLNENVRSWNNAWSRFSYTQMSRFTIMRAMWDCLSTHGTLDDEVVAARSQCRHPSIDMMSL